MKKISVIPFAILLGLMLIISGCADASEASEKSAVDAAQVAPAAQTAAQEEEKVTNVPVEIAIIETGDISLIFSYSGSLKPQDELKIIPGAAGRIESVYVEEGDAVKAGDLIASIEDDTYQVQVKQAEAALTQTKLNLVKMELGSRPEEIAASQAAVQLARAALNDVALVSDDERTTAAAALANAEAALKIAQAEYDKIAWAGDIGSTPQAASLQQATIAYESALAGYNLGTNPSDSQLAPLMLQLAQAQLNLALRIEPFRQVDFASAEAGIAQAEAALEMAQLQLAETEIYAPFEGVVNQVNITTGSRVSQQTPVLDLISSALEVLVDVPESRISQIEAGQRASLQVTAYPGQDFPGVVSSISTSADPDTRTFTVKITPVEGTDLLRSGMYADSSILAQENKNTILAPRQAIILDGDQPTVFVVDDDNMVEQRPVTTGLYDEQQIEILAGLKEGDIVVIAGQSNLQAGLEVDVVNDPRIAE